MLNVEPRSASHSSTARRLRASSALEELDKDVLNRVLLLLPATAVGALACTCLTLRDNVYQQPLSIWRRVAAEVLGPRHPVLRTGTADRPDADVASLRAALLQYSTVAANLRSGAFRPGALPQAVQCQYHVTPQKGILRQAATSKYTGKRPSMPFNEHSGLRGAERGGVMHKSPA